MLFSKIQGLFRAAMCRHYSWAILAMSLSANLLSGCEKFVETDLPNTKITTEAVFQSESTATAAALGMYGLLQQINSFSASGAPSSITVLAGVYADELTNYYEPDKMFAQNNLVASDAPVLSLWTSAYQTIYTANAIIEGVRASSALSTDLQRQLEGEARFVRAFCHFYLVNMFGDIPYVDTTEYTINAMASRMATDKVYEKMISDLQIAQTLLGKNYITADRCRPNYWAATALLARVYLYIQQWQQAEQMASEVISEQELFMLVQDLNQVFLSQSTEAIWQLAAINSPFRTWDAYYFVLTAPPTVVSLSNTLASQFESGDARFTSWISQYNNAGDQYYFPYKYKDKTGSATPVEHAVVLRLAEQYLIRAEARAHLDILAGSESAAADVDTIRVRAGLAPTPAATAEELLTAIEKERRLEFFAEWGHRWFDLRRTGRAEAILSAVKPNWDAKDLFFPLPEKEMINNPNLKPQNEGY